MYRTRIAWLLTLVCLTTIVEVAPESAGCDAPQVNTNKKGYQPGEMVSISGCGFGFHEAVSLVITGPDGRMRTADAQGKPGKHDLTADANGTLALTYEVADRRTARAGDSGSYHVTVTTPSGLALTSAEFSSVATNYTATPDFFWLPPTIPAALPFTGPFDSDALGDLAVEVCQLNDEAIFAYALDDFGGFTKIATIASGLAGVMDLHFDRETQDLWAICDDGCEGQSVVLRIDPTTHRFVVVRLFARPATMPNVNNEGFTIAPQAECASGGRPVFWSDDAAPANGGTAIRQGTMICTAVP